jgi:hypothetical protein
MGDPSRKSPFPMTGRTIRTSRGETPYEPLSLRSVARLIQYSPTLRATRACSGRWHDRPSADCLNGTKHVEVTVRFGLSLMSAATSFL